MISTQAIQKIIREAAEKTGMENRKFYAAEHFRTITHHRHLVMQHCFRMGLYRQGLMHDLSKYAPVEFLEGCRYWQGTRSPNNAAREATGVSMSWLHHKGRNRHHFEYWVDYGAKPTERVLEGMPMPRIYVAEMIADRVAASQVYKGDEYTDEAPLAYFLNSKKKLWFVHPQVLDQLEELLGMVAERGQDAAFDYIREVFLKAKDADKPVLEEQYREPLHRHS